MATLRREIVTAAPPEAVWDAVRDIGALHTRLVPGFVVDTKLELGARIVTFANGAVIREPIVACDEARRRLVWSAQGGGLAHYNASAQVLAEPDGGTRVLWIADFLPDEVAQSIGPAMDAGAAAMKACLDRLARTARSD